MDAIKAASKHGLKDVYTRNDYIYLVNEDGTDGVFKGFNGKLNEGVEAPYLICTKHTKESWEEYQNSQIIVPDEPLPGEPDDGEFVG